MDKALLEALHTLSLTEEEVLEKLVPLKVAILASKQPWAKKFQLQGISPRTYVSIAEALRDLTRQTTNYRIATKAVAEKLGVEESIVHRAFYEIHAPGTYIVSFKLSRMRGTSRAWGLKEEAEAAKEHGGSFPKFKVLVLKRIEEKGARSKDSRTLLEMTKDSASWDDFIDKMAVCHLAYGDKGNF